MRSYWKKDALTGLKNRHVFDEHLRLTWLKAQRERRSLWILMLDVDHFKRYNDGHRHQAGDEALRRVSQEIRKIVRCPPDIAARYGGEEFAVGLLER